MGFCGRGRKQDRCQDEATCFITFGGSYYPFCFVVNDFSARLIIRSNRDGADPKGKHLQYCVWFGPSIPISPGESSAK